MLQFKPKLSHGQTGPLKFTFILNTLEPPTTLSFGGKIIIDIRPQIPYPPIGTLRCFFYNIIPAESCVWDMSDPEKTTVTMISATDLPYQTNIPIAITSE